MKILWCYGILETFSFTISERLNNTIIAGKPTIPEHYPIHRESAIGNRFLLELYQTDMKMKRLEANLLKLIRKKRNRLIIPFRF